MIHLIILFMSIQVQITPVAGQVAIGVHTVGHATDGTPYFAYQRYDLEPQQDRVEAPRDRLRPGHYLMQAFLIVNTTTDQDPTKERVVATAAVSFDEPSALVPDDGA